MKCPHNRKLDLQKALYTEEGVAVKKILTFAESGIIVASLDETPERAVLYGTCGCYWLHSHVKCSMDLTNTPLLVDGNSTNNVLDSAVPQHEHIAEVTSDDQLINHPPHYLNSAAQCRNCSTQIECIDITEHLNFNLGNTIKYIWRCEHKDTKMRNLKKALWYLQREIKKEERRWKHVLYK